MDTRFSEWHRVTNISRHKMAGGLSVTPALAFALILQRFGADLKTCSLEPGGTVLSPVVPPILTFTCNVPTRARLIRHYLDE